MLNPTMSGVDEMDDATTSVVVDNKMKTLIKFPAIVHGNLPPKSVSRVNPIKPDHKKHVPKKNQFTLFKLAWWKLYLDNFATYVETTGLHGAVHAVEKMDAISQAPSLPMKTYLDK